MADQPIGPILDEPVEDGAIDLDDGELVEAAVVITKLVGESGQVLLGLYGTEGLSWLDKIGLVEAAKQRLTAAPWGDRDD